MQLRVSAPGTDLQNGELDRIEKDLDKIDRRLKEYDPVKAEVRVAKETNSGAPVYRVVLEVGFGRNHLLAKAENGDVGLAVRTAREEIMRQINDRSNRGHSSFLKGR